MSKGELWKQLLLLNTRSTFFFSDYNGLKIHILAYKAQMSLTKVTCACIEDCCLEHSEHLHPFFSCYNEFFAF